MKAPRTGLTSLPVIAILAIPSVAPAAYLVPPENSAATQYTEAYPTAGGSRNVEAGGKRGGGSPEQVLGGRNARKLEAQGPAGQATAEVVAATAPSTAGGGSPTSGGEAGAGDGEQGAAAQRDGAAGSTGASGVGEVLGQASGSSSYGGIGLLLPLAIVAAIAWAMAYLLRQRKRTA